MILITIINILHEQELVIGGLQKVHNPKYKQKL